MNIQGVKYITPQEFQDEFGTLFNSNFILNAFLPEIPFKNREWKIALLPYGEMNFQEVDLLALIQAIQAIGDKEVIIVTFDTESPEQAVVPLDYESLYQIRYPTSFGMFESYLFGRSGTWGIVSYYDSWFCVGGNNNFMDLFARKAGGNQALKERFLEYMNTEWYPMLNAKLKPNAEKVLNEILARVGWDK